MTLTEKHNWLIMNGKRQVGYWLNGIFDEKLSKTVRDISKIKEPDEIFWEEIKECYIKEDNPIALTAVIQNPYCPNDIKMKIWENHFEKIKDSWESIYSFEPNIELVLQGMKYIPCISDAQMRNVIEDKLCILMNYININKSKSEDLFPQRVMENILDYLIEKRPIGFSYDDLSFYTKFPISKYLKIAENVEPIATAFASNQKLEESIRNQFFDVGADFNGIENPTEHMVKEMYQSIIATLSEDKDVNFESAEKGMFLKSVGLEMKYESYREALYALTNMVKGEQLTEDMELDLYYQLKHANYPIKKDNLFYELIIHTKSQHVMDEVIKENEKSKTVLGLNRHISRSVAYGRYQDILSKLGKVSGQKEKTVNMLSKYRMEILNLSRVQSIPYDLYRILRDMNYEGQKNNRIEVVGGAVNRQLDIFDFIDNRHPERFPKEFCEDYIKEKNQKGNKHRMADMVALLSFHKARENHLSKKETLSQIIKDVKQYVENNKDMTAKEEYNIESHLVSSLYTQYDTYRLKERDGYEELEKQVNEKLDMLYEGHFCYTDYLRIAPEYINELYPIVMEMKEIEKEQKEKEMEEKLNGER